MAFANTLIPTVIQAILDRLQAQLSVTDAICYYSLSDTSEPPDHQGDVVYRVRPTGGTFDSGMWDGGGLAQTVPDLNIEIQIWVLLHQDEYDHDREAALDATYGVFGKLQLVNAALNAHYLLDGSSNTILREPLQPLTFDGPNKGPSGWVVLTMNYGALFDLNFS